MKNNSLFIQILFCGLLLSFTGCKDTDPDENKHPFNRQAMLQELGNNVIIPNYQLLQNQTDLLQSIVNQFVADPATNVTNVRMVFRSAYLTWQSASALEIGPAEDAMLRLQLNTYPTDTSLILNKIASNGNPVAYAEKGFPALDYLLFPPNKTDPGVAAQFISDPNRKAYLLKVVADIKTLVDATTNAWLPSGGNYINTFVNVSGTDVGSSAGMLVNQLNADLEMIKTNKLGIPLGKKTLGTPRPEKAEAYYSGLSNELAIENMKGIYNLYSGSDRSGTNHLGFDDYLDYVEAKSGDGRKLTEAINAKVNAINAALQSIGSPIATAVISNNAAVEKAYEEVRTAVVLFKTDMPSALGILITYQDNDGD